MSQVFIGLVSLYTFFFRPQSISCFLKVSRVNHKRQTYNSAQDKTHNVISSITRFMKFIYSQGKQLPCGLISRASSTIADKVLAIWRDDFSRNISCIPLFFQVPSCQPRVRSIVLHCILLIEILCFSSFQVTVLLIQQTFPLCYEPFYEFLIFRFTGASSELK